MLNYVYKFYVEENRMKLLLLTLILTVVGCSGSKPISSVEELDSGIQLTDSEEFAEGTEEDDIVAENTEVMVFLRR